MFASRALAILPRRAMSTQVTQPPTKPGAHEPKGVGYKPNPLEKDIYLNPLLTPPPRSPRTSDDFMNPSRLGHWKSMGFNYSSPVKDKYLFHEGMFYFIVCGMFSLWLWYYSPDHKLREWSKREAFLRTHKREALGLPLIDKNVVDPERIVLPTEEELGDFPVTM